ncbi:MAG: hypothetical protein LPD71_06975 [Shewanella sp.]|nr:hypothetical protein [Shewanella sp.]MCF1432016.1 hypothetical protein [Shewanella sp.]MCF1438485.1 hypothetical protein [Shewanella sp.]MCF1459466.1 hypothetical protein [Shewanella sp.]
MSHSERFDKWDDEFKKSKVKKVKSRRRDIKRRKVDEEGYSDTFLRQMELTANQI